ncbi:MAG: hypothetical protein Q7T89_16450, partial [Anaerolineales bacterium]|nr:hypothetical protein [Anaerolineales bacterium]
MKNKRPLRNFLTAFFLMLLTVSTLQPVSAQGEELLTVSGWFNVVWGDARNGIPLPPIYTLTDDNGQKSTLLINEESAALPAGILYLDRQHVTIQGAQDLSALTDDGTTVIQVEAITLDDADVSALSEVEALAVTGNQPFVSIMCKFADVSGEPKNLSYFQGMYGSSYPGLDHYWREVSYDAINIQGSNAYGWYTLPQPRSYYVYSGIFNFDRATTDCIGKANSDVNFSNFTGINLMFNEELNGYAWGGSRYMTLDGITKSWPITWEPPWGYGNSGVISHEMGHAFGLPHSSGNYG